MQAHTLNNHIMTQLSLPLKDSETIYLHYQKRQIFNANIITLSKN